MQEKHPLLISRGVKPRKGIVLNCLICHTDFYCRPCFIGKQRYCSVPCKNKSLEKKKVKLKCANCKIFYYALPSVYKWNKIRKHKYHFCSKKCQDKFFTGESNPRWIKNRNQLHSRRALGSAEQQKWRKSVFERDNYTCQHCGIKNHKGLGKTIRLEADHIKPWVLFPKLRTVISNGRTLCAICHNKTKRHISMLRKIWQKKDKNVL